MLCTRRELGQVLLAALPAGTLLSGRRALAAQPRPDSRVRGVMIGMNVPYNFGGRNASIDDIIRNCVQLGISGVELRTQPVESFLGVSPHLLAAGRGRGGAPVAADDEAARRANADELRRWRLALPMDRVQALRRRFDEAGVLIEIVKVDGILTMSDGETDYAFTLAKNLGARAISTEISPEGTKRLGAFADRHRLMVGYHGHASTGASDYEAPLGHAKYNGVNLDIGHFVAGQNTSPVPFIRQHHSRITHIHVKDRRMNNGPNVPFGQGDTPIREVLQLLRDNQWNIQATIEFEYPIPEASDRMTELRKCVEFCRAALA